MNSIINDSKATVTVANDKAEYFSGAYQNLDILSNDAKVIGSNKQYIHELIEEQAKCNPAKTAVVFGNQTLSYGELNAKANQLAHYLKGLGVVPGMEVGICIPRSLEMVIGLLGVLKVGGAYVPYDPNYPKERLQAMLQEIPVKVLLSTDSCDGINVSYGIARVSLDGDWEKIAREVSTNPVEKTRLNSCAYVIFTSGSTGKPKAAAIYHRGWINLMSWFVKEFDITQTDKVLIFSSFSFDITQRSLVMPLISGGELHLLASEYYSPALILDTLKTQKITLINCTPSAFYPLIEINDENNYEKLSSLRRVFLGGEGIAGNRLKEWVSSPYCKAELVNVYGTAECTDVSTFYRLYDFDQYLHSPVPIGKPIANTRVYVVGDDLLPVPKGVVGELCIAGDGLGKGYLNDEILAQKRFVAAKFEPVIGEQLYRTGDLARVLNDGNIEFVGRVDHQVKMHGNRIELGEIEFLLNGYPCIQEAVVLMEKDARSIERLVAYIVLHTQKFHHLTSEDAWKTCVDDVRHELGNHLPKYMIPSSFVKLEKMPLNPNGKVNRQALQLEQVESSDTEYCESPLTTTEIVTAAFFSEALNVDKVGIHDDFFDLGGHSLLALQVIIRLNETFGLHLDLSLFNGEVSSVANIAKLVSIEQKALTKS